MSRGGKRDGAGRPTKDGIARKRLTVAIREDLLAELTRQAEAQGCSLSDRVNTLLASQLREQPANRPAQAKPSSRKPATVAASAPTVAAAPAATDDAAFYDQLMSQVDAFDRELTAMQLDDEQAEPVPTYQQLSKLVRRWQNNRSTVNRRTQAVQYWRKAYRQDKAFRKAVDRIISLNPDGLRDLILDGQFSLSSHKEVLALAELPSDTLKRTLARMLEGQALKQALGTEAEAFRQLATNHGRQKDSLFSRYYFFEEL